MYFKLSVLRQGENWKKDFNVETFHQEIKDWDHEADQNEYSVIFCNWTLEYLDEGDIEDFIKKCLSKLTSDGYLILKMSDFARLGYTQQLNNDAQQYLRNEV